MRSKSHLENCWIKNLPKICYLSRSWFSSERDDYVFQKKSYMFNFK